MGLRKCCVGGCSSTNETHRLFSFPRNERLCSLWMSFLVPKNSLLLGLSREQLLDLEIAHDQPLRTEEWSVLNEHNYSQMESDDDSNLNVDETADVLTRSPQFFCSLTRREKEELMDHDYNQQTSLNEADASRAVETGSGEAPLPIVLPNVGSEIQALDSESQVKKPEPLTDLIDQSNDSTQIEYDDVDTFPQDVIILTINADPEPSIETNTQNSEQGWRKREQELLRKIEELEKSKREQGEDSVKLQLKVREDQIDLLKTRVHNLETKLEAALSKPTGKNHEMIENIKQQHEELLNKARGMIFEKTKMLKNQELQIEALTSQVQSLKDVNVITKDLLDIRNSEVKAMEDRLQVMEARFKAEKERYDLVLRRAQTSTNINDDLRKEYETQLAIFKELREKYEQRVQALVAENNRLKGSAGGSKEPPTQAP